MAYNFNGAMEEFKVVSILEGFFRISAIQKESIV